MGGLIADERRAANKKRILHISLGFIIGLLVGGIGVGWLAQWANGTDWRDVGGSLIVRVCSATPSDPEESVHEEINV